MLLVTLEGHKLLTGSAEQGITLTLFPSQPTFDNEVQDILNLGIKFSNVARLLREMDSPGGFRGEGWTWTISREDGQITLHVSEPSYSPHALRARLSQSDSEKLYSLLRECLDGTTHLGMLDQGPKLGFKDKVGRNDPCPCGSGRKYKKCCASHQPQKALPAELSGYNVVQDPRVQGMLEYAAEKPGSIHNPEFWWALGQSLGQAGAHELALSALDKSIALDPNNPVFRADYAVILDQLGQHNEALALLLSLPNASGQFSILIANLLCSLGRVDEAALHYERAVAYDPHFPLSYEALIELNREKGGPLYEYWLRRAMNLFPHSPSIAHSYTRWLLDENRLEELAEATWASELRHEPDSRILGMRAEGPRKILEIQVLQGIARSLIHEDIAQLQQAIKVLEASPREWDVCHIARSAINASSRAGRRDLVWAASRRLCSSCAAYPHWVQGSLASAALVAGNPHAAIADVELGLKHAPEEPELLNIYWWALDETDRSEEALAVGRRLEKLGHEELNFFYNLGYIAGRAHQPGAAIDYYEKQLGREPRHPQSIENLALLRLLEGEIDAADALAARWEKLFEKLCESDQMQTELKMAKYRTLAGHAAAHKGGRSLALDLIRMNEANPPVFGAEVRIPKRIPTPQELVASILSQDAHGQRELTFAHAMERRGDYSILLAQLEEVLPAIHKLPEEAIRSLVEGQRQVAEEQRPDYAPCCLAFCKALEIALTKGVFEAFRDDIKANADYEPICKQSLEPCCEKALPFSHFITKGSPMELGRIGFTLSLCTGRTGRDSRLLSEFRQWLVDQALGAVLEVDFRNKLDQLAREFRNPAAHSSAYSRQEAIEARRLCMELLSIVYPPHKGTENPDRNQF